MIETEHALHKTACRAGEKRCERSFTRSNWDLLQREERVPRALSATYFERPVIDFDHATNSHLGVGVNKVERRSRMDAEQQILDGRQRRGLTSLIWPEHDVKVREMFEPWQID